MSIMWKFALFFFGASVLCWASDKYGSIELYYKGKKCPELNEIQLQVVSETLDDALRLPWRGFRRLVTKSLVTELRRGVVAAEVEYSQPHILKFGEGHEFTVSRWLIGLDPKQDNDLLLIYGTPKYDDFNLVGVSGSDESNAIVSRLRDVCE